MLYHYLDHKRKESSAPLHATYLVSGKFVHKGQPVRNATNGTRVACFFVQGLDFHIVLPILCLFLESPGVRCQRGPVGRCVDYRFLSIRFINGDVFGYLTSCVFSVSDFKSKMSLIVSVHVYSVQKALLKDSGPLYSVDYDAVKDNLKNCSRCVGHVPQCQTTVPKKTAQMFTCSLEGSLFLSCFVHSSGC